MGSLKLLQELEKAPTEIDRWKIFLSTYDEEKIHDPATRKDLSETELRLRKEIEEIRLEIKTTEGAIRKDMQAMEGNIRKDMQAMEGNIRKDMQAMEGSIRKEIEELKLGQKQLEVNLSKQMTRHLIITITILGVFLTVFRVMGEIFK